MVRLTHEQMRIIKKYAEDLGFKSNISFEEEHATFSVSAGLRISRFCITQKVSVAGPRLLLTGQAVRAGKPV